MNKILRERPRFFELCTYIKMLLLCCAIFCFVYLPLCNLVKASFSIYLLGERFEFQLNFRVSILCCS